MATAKILDLVLVIFMNFDRHHPDQGVARLRCSILDELLKLCTAQTGLDRRPSPWRPPVDVAAPFLVKDSDDEGKVVFWEALVRVECEQVIWPRDQSGVKRWECGVKPEVKVRRRVHTARLCAPRVNQEQEPPLDVPEGDSAQGADDVKPKPVPDPPAQSAFCQFSRTATFIAVGQPGQRSRTRRTWALDGLATVFGTVGVPLRS